MFSCVVLFFLPFFPEVVDAQGGREAAALFVPDGGAHQNDGCDQEGQSLVHLGGDLCQPA